MGCWGASFVEDADESLGREVDALLRVEMDELLGMGLGALLGTDVEVSILSGDSL